MPLDRRFLVSRVRKTLTRYPRALEAFEVLCEAYRAGFRAPALLLKTLYYSRYGDIVVHPNTQITGGRWLSVLGKLTIGKPFRYLMHPSDQTIVDLHGHLNTRGDVLIGKGCRISGGSRAHCVFGGLLHQRQRARHHPPRPDDRGRVGHLMGLSVSRRRLAYARLSRQTS